MSTQQRKMRGVSGKFDLEWLGGPSIRFMGDNVEGFVDPFFSNWSDGEWIRVSPPSIDPISVKRCDLILITHEHEDHCDPVTIRALVKNNNPLIFAPEPSAIRLRNELRKLAEEMNLYEVEAGDKRAFRSLTIQVFQTFDPLSKGAVGYILDGGGKRVAFMGDSLFDKNVLSVVKTVDLVFISVGNNPPDKKYYYSIEELLEAASILYPTLVVPIHWDLWTKTFIDLSSHEFREYLSSASGNILIPSLNKEFTL